MKKKCLVIVTCGAIVGAAAGRGGFFMLLFLALNSDNDLKP